MFRLSRIKKTAVTDRAFDRRRLRLPEAKQIQDGEANTGQKPPVPIVLQFTEEAHYRLCDDYDDEAIIKNPDGTYTLVLNVNDDEWVYGYILSFGSYVKVLAPEHVKRIIKERCEKMLGYYI
jgi:Predicted transcriptional regulator